MSPTPPAKPAAITRFSNSFGFGGQNISLVVGRFRDWRRLFFLDAIEALAAAKKSCLPTAAGEASIGSFEQIHRFDLKLVGVFDHDGVSVATDEINMSSGSDGRGIDP